MDVQELLGRDVVALSDARHIGHVDSLYLDVQNARVVGLRVKHSLLGHSRAVARDRVSAVGADAVTIDNPAMLHDADRISELAGTRTLDELLGAKVVTEGGETLGTVSALAIDVQARTIEGYTYELDAGFWQHVRHQEQRKTLGAHDVIRLGGHGIMIVPDSMAPRPEAADTSESTQTSTPTS